MHSTSLKNWATSVLVNIIFVGGLVFGLWINSKLLIDVIVFFTWAMCVLSWLVCMLMIFAPILHKSVITSLKEKLEDQLLPKEKRDELGAKLAETQAALDKLWDDKVIDKMAKSTTYLWYSWIINVVFITALIAAGRYWLATAQFITDVIIFLLFMFARDAKEKKLRDAPRPPMYVVQTNNVAGGDIAGGDIHK